MFSAPIVRRLREDNQRSSAVDFFAASKMKVTMLMLLIGAISAVSAAPQFDLNNNQKTPYSFAYGVNSPDTGDVKEHKEAVSPQGTTEGEYRWLQPNGLFRVTRYTADNAGYRATVSEEPGENIPTYYRNSLQQSPSGTFSSQGNQPSFSSFQSQNQGSSGSQSGNQGFNNFQSTNQNFNRFQSNNQGSSRVQFENKGSSNFQSGNQRFNNQNFQNQAFTTSTTSQNQAFSFSPNFQNQQFTSFQSSQPQRFTSGQSFQNQGFGTSQTFQNQGNIIDGGIIDGGIINGGIIDGGIVGSTTTRNFGTSFSQFGSSQNNNFGSNFGNSNANFNRFGNNRFSSSNINRGVAVVLSSNSN